MRDTNFKLQNYMKIAFQKKKVFTKGNINVLDIKIGDIQYEFEYNYGIKSTVVSLPTKSEDGTWSWSNKLSSGSIINYSVNENYQHYGPNLYDCIAYEVKSWLG